MCLLSNYDQLLAASEIPASPLKERLKTAFPLLSHGESNRRTDIWKQELQVEDFPQ